MTGPQDPAEAMGPAEAKGPAGAIAGQPGRQCRLATAARTGRVRLASR